MTVVDGSAYPGQVEVTILNTTDTEIDSGNSADFFLQVEQDGQWYNLIPKRKEYDNTAEGYIYNEDAPWEMTFQWASLYGSLDPGHYRAVKWFSEFHEDETDPDKRNINFALAAEFDIK